MAKPIIIDAHVHVYRNREQGLLSKENYEIWEYGTKADVRFSAYSGDLGDVLRAIDDAGASRAVVVNLFAISFARSEAIAELPGGLDEAQKEEALKAIDASMGERLKTFNAWACDIAKEYPQLVPFVAADPWVLSIEEMQTHIREMVDCQGAKGIKVHPVLQRFYMYDERMLPIYRICVEMGIPIIAHSGPSRDVNQYAEPRSFAKTLKAFPELRLVLAHMGGGAWRQLLELAQAYPNAYFDCCEIMEWTGAPNAPTNHELAQLILDVGPERVMMGSDFPWYDIDHSVERVMELPLLSTEQKEALLGANAIRILGL